MRRIIVILFIAFLLMPAPHSSKQDRAVAGPLVVAISRLPLDIENPGRRRLGPLRFLGAWRLSSANPAFGGISSLSASSDGWLLALNDTGTLMGFAVDEGARGHPFIAPLPIRKAERGWPVWKWDSESLTRDPASGQWWVGFELIHRICRYGAGFPRVAACAEPEQMQDWPVTGGVEAMVRLADGRFLLFGELASGPNGVGSDLLLFPGDPTAPGARATRLSYVAPSGYVPTDVVQLDTRHLIVLNRRVGLEGFTAVLALVDLPARMVEGTVLKARPIARLAPPILAENYEAMALASDRNGRRILWVAADDNHEFFQRSLLLKFALPENWP